MTGRSAVFDARLIRYLATPVQTNVLAGLLGLDTTDCGIGYIAGGGDGGLEVITDTARAVLATVHTLAAATWRRQHPHTQGDTGR